MASLRLVRPMRMLAHHRRSLFLNTLFAARTLKLFSSESQPQDHENTLATVKELPTGLFVGREDQKVEEQKRRRLSDVRILCFWRVTVL